LLASNAAEPTPRRAAICYSLHVLTVEEALEQILSRVHTLPTERVPILSALGRALAESVVSSREIPPWPNSTMD
jgi:molybdopterin molybdotransferase